MITKPTKMLPYIYIERDVCTCTMIIAFIIALCLNKCKLQAYVLGNTQKILNVGMMSQNQRSQSEIRRAYFGTN